MDKKRDEKLKNICEKINKSLKEKDIVNYIGNKEIEPLPRFSSGSLEIDEALGGGWPIGRICELYGKESSGKTSLCYHAIAEFQKKFPISDVAWIDSEFSFDPSYAKQLGVNVDPIIVNQP